MSALADLPVELQLILSCLRVSPNEREIAQIQTSAQSGVDWDLISMWVGRHRAVPLVYTHLRQFAWQAVPERIRPDLQGRFSANTFRNMALAAELVRVLKLLEEHGISGLPFKGVMVALQVYGDLALRPAGDIDILIDPRNIDRADGILRGDRYRRVTCGNADLSASQKKTIERAFHHFNYYSEDNRITVELHWRLTGKRSLFPVNFEQLQRRARTQSVAGYRTKTLSSEDMVIHLFVHGATHAWYRLAWLCDVATLARRGHICDWPGLMAKCTDLGLERSLVQGALLAHDLLGSPVHQVVQAHGGRDRKVATLLEAAISKITQKAPQSLSVVETAQLELRYRLRLRRSLRYKVDALVDLSVNAEDWGLLPLPDYLFPLYLVLRPFFWCMRRLGLLPGDVSSRR